MMKQEIVSYLSTEKKSLSQLNKFLYDNPEESYCEHKACSYISDFLKERGFDVENNFQNIETSFFASKGSGHPKICFICEYDAIKDEGHITGHNLLTMTSITGAIGLGHVINKLHGSVYVIGCPGEYLGGTNATFVRQNVYDDIDVVLLAHPDLITSESGTSSAIIPLSIKYSGKNGLSFLDEGNCTSLDGVLLTFDILNYALKSVKEDTTVNYAITKGGITPLLRPKESEAQFYIRCISINKAKQMEEKIRNICSYVCNLMDLNCSISLYESPSEELLTNITLSRLFCNNLKETGIINIDDFRNVNAGLSIGCVSQKVPVIHPFISICKDRSIHYGTKQFADCTITDYAVSQCIKAGIALSYTGLDMIDSENLLSEVKSEFYNNNRLLY